MGAQITLTTYKDMIDHVTDYYGSVQAGDALRDDRRAVQAAYRAYTSSHRWSYYYTRGRLNSVAPYSTGTITYTQSTRTITLLGGTFPSWAGVGQIQITGVIYQVASLTDSTHLVLTSQSNPTADIATATNYTLFQDAYPLPVDCLATDEMINVTNYARLSYEQPREWLNRQRLNTGQAVPTIYTITGSQNYLGSLCVRFYPPPNGFYQFDFIYQRRPRPLVLAEYKAGTVNTSAASNIVTGQGTAWTSSMCGAVMRFSSDGKTLPTGPAGANLYTAERVVTTVTDTTHLTVDAVLPVTLSAVLYNISDPVDIEEGAMLTGFLRECEKQGRLARRITANDEEMAEYRMAMLQAREADSRSLAPKSEGHQAPFYQRLGNMPQGPDVG